MVVGVIVAQMEIALSNGYVFDDAVNNDVVFYCAFSNQRILMGNASNDPALTLAPDYVRLGKSFIPMCNDALNIGSETSPFHNLYTKSIFSKGIALSDTASTVSKISFSNYSGCNVITSYGGNVGINTDHPMYTLDVEGDIFARGTISHSSDQRFKTDIEPITDALQKVSGMKGCYYRRSDYAPETRHIGMIAQHVEAVVPELVSTDALGFKSIAYGNTVAVLIEAIKELNIKVDVLKHEVVQLNHKVFGRQPIATLSVS